MMAIVVYMLLTWHYKNTFVVNTWINGVYCTGKTIDEINSELLSTTKAPNVAIKDKDGNLWELDLKDIGYSLDYTISLEAYVNNQNPWLWFENAIEKKNNTVYPVFTYDEALLLKYWEGLPFVKEEKNKPMTVAIEWTENGYVLENNLTGRLDLGKCFEVLKDSINDHKTTIIDLKKKFQGEIFYQFS